MNCFPWNAPCFQMPCVQVLTPVRVRLSTSENGPRWGNDTSCSILKQNGILRTLTFKSRLKCGDLSTTGTGSFGATTPPIKRTSTPTVSAILQARSGESRRAVLQGALAGVVAGIVLVAQPAGAQLALKSRTCDTPCTLTIQNGAINQFLDVYWLNYDGDAELFATIPPGGLYTIETFETHPWRLVNARTGGLVKQLVASGSFSNILVTDADFDSETVMAAPEPADFSGFDGIGGDTSEYASAKLAGLAIDTDGAVATLAMDVDGYDVPFGLTIGLPEALAILHSSMPDTRRPGTVGAWANTLEAVGVTVERILITRLVGSTYYARIVLAGPAGMYRSVDARPSDSIALAIRKKSPIFVAKTLAQDAARAFEEEDDLERMLERMRLPKDKPGYMQMVDA